MISVSLVLNCCILDQQKLRAMNEANKQKRDVERWVFILKIRFK